MIKNEKEQQFGGGCSICELDKSQLPFISWVSKRSSLLLTTS